MSKINIMRKNSLFKAAALVVAIGSMAATQSKAALIVGEISFIGGANLTGPGVPTAATATGIDFNYALVGGGSGDYQVFSSFPGWLTPTNFTDFTFGAVGTVGPAVVVPLWTFVFGGQTYDFSLASISVNALTGSQRLLEGEGIATISGGSFTPTPAHWSLSTSAAETKVVFSSSTNSVPDGGASVALLGISLVGLAGVSRKLRQ